MCLKLCAMCLALILPAAGNPVVRRATVSAVGEVSSMSAKRAHIVRKVIESEDDIHYVLLKNKGTHSEVDIEVGTAKDNTTRQSFSVVADTGSNNVIVPSCTCQTNEYETCKKGDPCFTGTGHSDTFHLVEDKTAKDGALHSELSFGSGSIQGVIAHDQVTLGAVAQHTKGIFLMTESELDVEIGGILGLGVPGSNLVMDQEAATVSSSSSSDGGGWADVDYDDQGSAGQGGGGGEVENVLKDVSHNESKIYFKQHPRGRRGRERDVITANGQAKPVPRDREAPPKLFPRGREALPMKRRQRGGGNHMRDRHTEDSKKNGWMKKRARSTYGRQTHGKPGRHMPDMTETHRSGMSYPGFLEQAKVAHFSMCFNEGKDGWLGMSKTVPASHQSSCVPNIGEAHWGTGLHGISVESKNSKANTRSLLQTPMIGSNDSKATAKVVSISDVCTKVGKDPAQISPCGAIPDSGTTAITGPQEQLDVLFDAICDNWERCSHNFTALKTAKKNAIAAEKAAVKDDIFQLEDVKVTKGDVLQSVMADCESWTKHSLAEGGGGLAELPSLKFKLCGHDKCQELELPGHLYVIEELASDLDKSNDLGSDGYEAKPEYLQGAGHVAVQSSAARAKQRAIARGAKKVCSCAFDPMEMKTTPTGPVWILGTPFFYAYKIGYSLAKTASTPAKAKAASVVQDARAGATNCISFKQTTDSSPCDAPESAKAASSPDVASDTAVKIGSLPQSIDTSSNKVHQPIRVRGPWRRPSWSFDL